MKNSVSNPVLNPVHRLVLGSLVKKPNPVVVWVCFTLWGTLRELCVMGPV